MGWLLAVSIFLSGAFEEIFGRLAGAFEELLCQDLKQQQQEQQQQQEKSEAHLIVLRTCSIVERFNCVMVVYWVPET